MLACVKTICFSGIKVIDIDVEVHFAKGQPGITIVGLGDKAVTESKERIRAVISTLGLILPPYRITINLAPADVIKEGTHFDLPILLGILVCMGVIKKETIERYVVIGELGLGCEIRHVNGVLPAALYANLKDMGIICPKDNGKEAAWGSKKMPIIAVETVDLLIKVLKGKAKVTRPEVTKENLIQTDNKDMSDVHGQLIAKYAIEVAAAGAHNVLLIGSPGTGKTMLASRIATILPPLTTQEMIDVNMIYSVAGYVKDGILTTRRPFRNPHHTISRYALTGGGVKAKPGEITLAHNGVLFLDELPEYQRDTLEVLRQPLESGEITITRVNAKIVYPARFQLVAAMNPCKCGYYGSKTHQCNCSVNSIKQYQSKVSGPLLDRIDMHIVMNDESYKFSNAQSIQEETSEQIKKRVIKAREIQSERYKKEIFKVNSQVPDGKLLQKYCIPTNNEVMKTIEKVSESFRMSMRGLNRFIRVIRTIADLDGDEEIAEKHIKKAINFRQKIFSQQS